ncbi:hypothetical protein [Streptomyces sp. URMC 124]|uniref:hypothetical protein n=1 Tax=Streptomyces sp. URMC 124 TaxID=3423405 RepID=UPI003F1E302A
MQYAVRSRDQVLHDPDMLDRIMAGDPSIPVRDLPTTPGMLVLHAGSISMHRVTPTAGTVPRFNASCISDGLASRDPSWWQDPEATFYPAEKDTVGR